MDKVVRIHLAKVPYEISIDAQEALKKYLDAIKKGLDPNVADETMTDIEVRITEILAERHVVRDGVITKQDVTAIEKQLGSPEQFSDSDSEAAHSVNESKRLLRDSDGAYIGGVASGLGAYFKIDPIFVRLIFIALTFLSGLGIALYIVLWVLVPAAKSSSEKLQMSGQAVTVESLQRYRSAVQERFADGPHQFRRLVRRLVKISFKVCRFALSVLLILVCLYILFMLCVGSSVAFIYPFRQIFTSYGPDYFGFGLGWAIGICMIGLLVIALLRIWGSRSSRLRYTTLGFATVFILAIAASGAAAIVIYNHFSNEYGNGKITKALAVTSTTPTETPTELLVLADANLNLTYVVTNQPVHATYQAEPGLGKPRLQITDNDGILTINSNDLVKMAPTCLGSVCRNIYLPVRVTIYGPAVQSIYDNNGAQLSISGATFNKSLALNATDYSPINFDNSYAKTLAINATHGGSIWADSSSAVQTTVTVDDSSTVYAPATTTISATLPKECNQVNAPLLSIENATTITINGQIQTSNELNQNVCISNNGNTGSWTSGNVVNNN